MRILRCIHRWKGLHTRTTPYDNSVPTTSSTYTGCSSITTVTRDLLVRTEGWNRAEKRAKGEPYVAAAPGPVLRVGADRGHEIWQQPCEE